MTNNERLRTPVPPSSMLTCNIYSIRQGGAKTIPFNLELGGAGVVSKLGAPIVLSNLMPATCNICSIHCLANQINIVHPFWQMQTRLAKQTTESIVLTTYQHFLHTLTHQGEKRKLCFNSDPLLATAGVSLKVEAMQLTAAASLCFMFVYVLCCVTVCFHVCCCACLFFKLDTTEIT